MDLSSRGSRLRQLNSGFSWAPAGFSAALNESAVGGELGGAGVVMNWVASRRRVNGVGIETRIGTTTAFPSPARQTSIVLGDQVFHRRTVRHIADERRELNGADHRRPAIAFLGLRTSMRLKLNCRSIACGHRTRGWCAGTPRQTVTGARHPYQQSRHGIDDAAPVRVSQRHPLRTEAVGGVMVTSLTVPLPARSASPRAWSAVRWKRRCSEPFHRCGRGRGRHHCPGRW